MSKKDKPGKKPKDKGKAKALVRSPESAAKAIETEEKARVKAEADARALAEKTNALRLAQIVNLHIGGHSLADIGAAIGATADEVDRMLQQDAQRYVRSQPALRVYVRNYVSKRLTDMLEVDMPIATDTNHAMMLEHQDRAIKLLDRMAKLHGAEAPVQTEVKVDAAPESIDRMVAALAAQAGRSYDMNVFDDDDDIVDAEVEEMPAIGAGVTVADLAQATDAALEVSGNAIDDEEDDGTWK